MTAADQFKKPVIACLGLAFKADIDDLRESPAMDITKALAKKNIGEIIVVEPNLKEIPKELIAYKVEVKTLEDALSIANIIVVLVDHKQFKESSKSEWAKKVVIDTRGLL